MGKKPTVKETLLRGFGGGGTGLLNAHFGQRSDYCAEKQKPVGPS